MNPETEELVDEEKDVTTYCWFDGIRLTDIFTDKLFHASGNKNISFYAGFKEHCSEGQTMIFNT
jgi:hypothetical protein